jgi:hypothetical protein
MAGAAAATMASDPEVTWRRTFPECEPGTDGVAIIGGEIIGRVRLQSELRHDEPLRWMWSVTDPKLPASTANRGNVRTREEAMGRLVDRWRELKAAVAPSAPES